MKILVLCHGSVNRSPFVAALIAAARPYWTVKVAGLKTHANRPATPKTRRAAEERGLTLAQHRSVVCTEELCREADIILYMDGGNARRLRELAGEKIFTSRALLLAEFGGLRRIPDPNYTSDREELRRIFATAELCTQRFLEAHP